jgi:hypothetical protein
MGIPATSTPASEILHRNPRLPNAARIAVANNEQLILIVNLVQWLPFFPEPILFLPFPISRSLRVLRQGPSQRKRAKFA